jgi:D-alanyl-D-alanine carboxypeptidase
VADRRTGAPMRLRDHVRIASITKTFTATAILQQVDRGRRKLSAKLDTFVKGIPNGRRITIRQLLAMRSGIYDFTADRTFERRFAANPLMRFRPRDIIPIIRRHRPLFRPGARTSYADSNYVLLGIVLEKITGRSARAVITHDIVDRLKLRHTSSRRRPGCHDRSRAATTRATPARVGSATTRP